MCAKNIYIKCTGLVATFVGTNMFIRLVYLLLFYMYNCTSSADNPRAIIWGLNRGTASSTMSEGAGQCGDLVQVFLTHTMYYGDPSLFASRYMQLCHFE